MKNIKKSLLMISVILVICLVNYSVSKISDRNIALVGWFIVPPIIGVIAAKIALKIEYNDKLIEFDKDYNYFRDLIKKYSPSILSVIYNSIKYPKLSMIGLLQLEKKGKIVLGDEISINPELMPVSLSEEYLLNSIKNNALNKENDYKYYDLLISECKNNHLMYQVPVKYIYNGLIKSVVVFFIFAAFLCLVGYALHNIELNEYLFYIGSTSLLLYIAYNFYYVVFNGDSVFHSCKLTDEGEEIYEKLKGLSHFLKDFSKLDEKDKIYIKQWDDYLIYSFIFNQNYKIYNDLGMYFEIE